MQERGETRTKFSLQTQAFDAWVWFSAQAHTELMLKKVSGQTQTASTLRKVGGHADSEVSTKSTAKALTAKSSFRGEKAMSANVAFDGGEKAAIWLRALSNIFTVVSLTNNAMKEPSLLTAVRVMFEESAVTNTPFLSLSKATILTLVLSCSNKAVSFRKLMLKTPSKTYWKIRVLVGMSQTETVEF